MSLAPLSGPGLARLRALGDLELDPWTAHVPVRLHGPNELRLRLGAVDVLLVEADHVPGEVLEGSGLRIVGACRGDPVNVDVPAATKAGIAVLNAPRRNATAVAELTLGLILALGRGIVAADRDVRRGAFVLDGTIPQQRYLAGELRSSVVGLVGCGAVGRATGRLLTGLGARVLGYDPYVDPSDLERDGIVPAPLDELLATADVVSVHAALNAETRGLIGTRELGLMRHGARLVNAARYEIVDEDALLEALRSGRLAGVALDHVKNEVLPPGHPLLGLPNVIVTPHIGGSTHETIAAHTEAMATGCEALLQGRRPPNIVNAEVLPVFPIRAAR